MAWYARGPERGRQIVTDVLIVLWCIGWGAVGRFVHGVIDRMGGPARASARMMQDMVDQLESLSRLAGRVPGVGEELGAPFRMLARALQDLVMQANAQAAETGTTASVVGTLFFVVPVLVALLWWLPRRLSFARKATVTQPLVDEPADLDLFALRAMANVDLAELNRVSADPVAAWRAGDQEVIRQLAELEFARLGLDPEPRPGGRTVARPAGSGDQAISR